MKRKQKNKPIDLLELVLQIVVGLITGIGLLIIEHLLF